MRVLGLLCLPVVELLVYQLLVLTHVPGILARRLGSAFSNQRQDNRSKALAP